MGIRTRPAAARRQRCVSLEVACGLITACPDSNLTGTTSRPSPTPAGDAAAAFDDFSSFALGVLGLPGELGGGVEGFFQGGLRDELAGLR